MTKDIYSIFGNKIRNNLIICLSRGNKNVSELISTCGLSQSAVSQHLAKLKHSGIVSSQKLGKEVIYSIKYPTAVHISTLLITLNKEINPS